MNDDERMIFEWFAINTKELVDFYLTLHIHNLARIFAMALEGRRHTLIPNDWPIESDWSFELLAASIMGACNNPEKKKELAEWYS